MDKKLTALVEGTEFANDDLLVYVDKSDTTMSADGSTKRVTREVLLDEAPLTSPTIVGWDGWQPYSHTWSRVGSSPSHEFTVAGDVTGIYRKGTKVKFTDTSVKYGVVGNSTFSSPNTTVTLISTSDFALVGATIDVNSVSHIENPTGFPNWFNYVPTITGYSVNPTGASYQWRTVANTLIVSLAEVGNGTSNSADTRYTLPVNSDASRGYFSTNLLALDNGSFFFSVYGVISVGDPERIDFGGFTASGDKKIFGFTLQYRF